MGGGARLNSESDVYPNIKTDGVYKCYYINKEDGTERNFLLQLECKLDIDFNNSADRAKVLLQVCCYLKQIHDNVSGFNGDWKTSDIPVVVVLGSKINCMTLATKWLLPYAQSHIVGYKSASTAYTKTENRQLLINIENESNIQAYSIVYDVMDKDCIKNICDSILKIGQGIDITDDLTENNISKAFDFFDMYVLDKKQANKLTSRQKVDLFIGTFYSEDFREDKSDRWAKRVDRLHINGETVRIDPIKYQSFKVMINMREYSREEQKRITAMTDRLIEDTDRRYKGDFYTPTIWVDEAHKLISRHLGEDWKNEYIVWDCAWGTGNLTRDYSFKHLYCSTLYKEDLRIGNKYNRDSYKFQYDFLNDDLSKIKVDAKELYENLNKHKSILFLINPPFGTASSRDVICKVDNSKRNIGNTRINNIMKHNKIGKSSQQLYAQFLYRIREIQKEFKLKCYVGLFCPLTLFTSKWYSGLRDYLNMYVLDSYMIQANQFANVSGSWAISFNLIELGVTKKYVNDIECKVLQYDSNCKEIAKHKLYALEELCSDWVRRDIKGLKCSKDTLHLTSGIQVYNGDKSKVRGTSIDNQLGYYVNIANKVWKNSQDVYLLSCTAASGNGNGIVLDNFNKVISNFSARRLITGRYANWINSEDEYMVPNINNSLYNQWQIDCVIYSLFNTASQQSSLRNIEYNERIWNIKNEFFWMSINDIKDLVKQNDKNIKIINDIDEFGNERFVYKKLQKVTLSPDAQEVLDKAIQLVKDSFKYRKEFNEKHPEYHINTWDAGWYQIKGLLKEYMPNELKEFNSLYKALEDRMRPLVYELGFLYK